MLCLGNYNVSSRLEELITQTFKVFLILNIKFYDNSTHLVVAQHTFILQW